MTDEEICKIFANNLNALIKKRGIKQVDIVNRLKVGKGTVSGWCKGANILRGKALSGLTQMLDIEPSALLMEKPVTQMDDRLSDDDRTMLEIYRSLPEQKRKAYLALLQAEETKL